MAGYIILNGAVETWSFRFEFQEIQWSPAVNARKIFIYFCNEMFSSAWSVPLILEITYDPALLQKSPLFTLRCLYIFLVSAVLQAEI